MTARQQPATPTPSDHDSPGWLLLLSPWLIAVMVLACLPLSGCERQEVIDAEQASSPFVVMTDSATGCEYLIVRSSGRAPTPRIAADGHTHMGCKGGAR